MIINKKDIRILIIDDQPSNLSFLSNLLVQQGYKVQRAISGKMVLDAKFASPPDLILLDIVMPEMNGYEVCKKLKANPEMQDVPIIFLSVLKETFNKVKAFEVGGIDYITKPFQVEEVLVRIENQLTIQMLSKQLKQQNKKLQNEIEIRKQAELSLRESERLFRAIFNNSFQLTGLLKPDGTVMEANQTALDFAGMQHEDIVGKPFWEIYSWTISPETQQQLKQAIVAAAQGEFVRYEVDIKSVGDKILTIDFSLKPLFDEIGKVILLIAEGRDITQRKQTEQELDRQNQLLQAEISTRLHTEKALQESEAQLRAIFAAMTDLVLVRDAQGRCIKLAPTNTSSLVKPATEMLGKTLHEVLPASVADSLYKSIQQALNSQQTVNIEYNIMVHDQQVWLDAKISPLFPNAVIIVARDITARKLAEEKLRASQQRLSFLVQQTPLAIIEWNTNFEIIAWNPAAEIIFGYSPQEIIGRNGIELLVPDNYKEQVNQILSMLHSQQGSNCTINENLTKDGKVIICEWYNTPLIDEHGNIIGGAGMALDITERKKAETALQESALREKAIAKTIERMRQTLDIEAIFRATTSELRQILNCDRIAIYRFNNKESGEFVAECVGDGWTPLLQVHLDNPDFQSTITDTNSHIDKLNLPDNFLDNTYLESPAIACSKFTNSLVVEDIYKAGLKPSHIQILEKFQAKAYIIVPIFCSNQLWGLLAAYQNSNSRRWKQAEINIMIQIANQLGVALQQAQLLAETQRQSLELMKAKEDADAANRAKSQFLAKMSHELRTPLNAILGFSQLMVRSHTLSLEQREHLGIINRSGEHLLNLINDILSLAKIEAGQITLNENNFDLHQLLNSIEELLQLKAYSKKLKLIFERNDDLPQYIQTDESKLRQILINLIGNAIKFTESGSITLRVKTGVGREKISAKFPIIFEVEDTGPGIDTSELHTLFDPFVQTKTGRQSMQGTGLGLPISKQFIRLMGGDITVTSQLGIGSIFTFHILVNLVSLPKKEQIYPPKRVIALQTNQPTYRILIVEDIQENRQLLLKILQPLGFDLREAENGQEAIALWQTWQPHLIWMDMEMPVMDGYEATRQIKQKPKGKDTVIIAITANAFEEQKKVIFQTGCDDFIAKPFQTETLFEKMAEHLGIRYIYEEDLFSIHPNSQSTINSITPDDLVVMSREWIAKLHAAALMVDDQKVMDLIQEIPDTEKKIANALTHLVDNFRMDIIIELTQKYIQ